MELFYLLLPIYAIWAYFNAKSTAIETNEHAHQFTPNTQDRISNEHQYISKED